MLQLLRNICLVWLVEVMNCWYNFVVVALAVLLLTYHNESTLAITYTI